MLVSQLCLTFGDPVVCPWDYPGRNTGVGCHFLLQGIFPTQGSNPHLLHRQADSLLLNHEVTHIYIYNIDLQIF